MASTPDVVAIIGAGIAGTALALALHQRGIRAQIYESRDATLTRTSGVSIAPNGCRALEKLGVLDRVRAHAYPVDGVVYVDPTGAAVQEPRPARGLRCYRAALLGELRTLASERGIEITYGVKFEGIVEDTSSGVTFLVNGQTHHASVLVGADGIHSTVRKHITTKTPEYTGLLCIYGHVPTASIPWPHPELGHVRTILDAPGALFMVPETADGADLMVGHQFAHPPLSREEQRVLEGDKDALCALLCRGYDQWSDIGRAILDQLRAHRDGLLLWPFAGMPALESWGSGTGRVVLVGDAAHAMPASSGQGANQALVDAGSLGVVLEGCVGAKGEGERLEEGVRFWSGARRREVEAVMSVGREIDVKRLPGEERRRVEEERWRGEASGSGSGRREAVAGQADERELEDVLREWVEAHT